MARRKRAVAAQKGWITRRLNEQLAEAKTPREAAAYKAHATRKLNALCG